MDVAYSELISRGAVFNGPPVTLTDGDLAGSQWAYLRDPDGIQLEIWQYPQTEPPTVAHPCTAAASPGAPPPLRVRGALPSSLPVLSCRTELSMPALRRDQIAV